MPRAASVSWPKIPDSCKNPIVFLDKNMGICMVAELCGGSVRTGLQWIMKVNEAGNWMTVRPVEPYDPIFVEALNIEGREVCTLSDDLLLDNFHWSKTSDKDYDLFRAELVCRLNPKPL